MAKSKSANVLALEAAKAEVARLKAIVQQEKANAKEARAARKAEREAKREAKRVAAVQKAQARLAKLTAPVGVKAKRMARRPSKVEVIELEAA